jgi:hypothetical protein
VADIVEQCGGPEDRATACVEQPILAFFQEGERAPGKMVGAECVLEAGVGGPGVDEVGEAELPDVAQALHGIRVEQSQRERLDTDVIPERIPYDLDVRGP